MSAKPFGSSARAVADLGAGVVLANVEIAAPLERVFQALTDPADVSYQIDRPHDPSEDVSIAFDDPELAIPWPLPATFRSPRDQQAPRLAAAARLLA